MPAMRITKREAVISALLALAILACSLLPGLAVFAFGPGLLVSSVFYPEGVHSGSGSQATIIGFASVTAVSSFVVWWTVAFSIMRGLRRRSEQG